MRAAQRRSFWKLLRLVRTVRFELRKGVLSGSEKCVSANTAGRILIELLRVTLVQLVFALGTAAALLVGNLYIPAAGWRWIPIPLWQLGNRDSYATFLSTISGIGGVLIGLYYAGLTAVSSSAYAQAPGVLRNLLLRQPVGKLYIRLLAYTTFVSLCLLSFYGAGFSPVRFAIPFLVVLSGITILSFVQLGQQAFYFFDPTKLAGSVFMDLERWVRRATVASRFWNDPSFQDHANQQAGAALKALTTLAEYSSLQNHLKSDALVDLATSTLGFLYRYEAARRLIPSESKWYPSEYQHPDFYTVGDIQMEVAARSSAPAQPAAVVRSGWVEDVALSVVFQALQTNLTERDGTLVFQVLSALSRYVERLGELWEIEEAFATVERVARIIAPVAFSAEGAAGESVRWRVGLAEYLSMLPVAALLGFVKSLDNAALGRVRSSLGGLRWGRPETLYRAGLPRFVLPTLEWFRPRLEFEVMAEGHVVTPPWFIRQAVVRDYLAAFHKSVNSLLNATGQFYGAWYQRSVDRHPWATAVVLSREGEYLMKLQANFDKISANEAEYQAAKVLPDVEGWPSREADAFRGRISKIEREYEMLLAREACRLVPVKRPPDIPDFAGKFLSRTAQTVLEAALLNDVVKFQGVFPSFFHASLIKVDSLLHSDETGGMAEEVRRVSVAMGPLLDLVELSGYAILVSELHQAPEPWQSAKALWDQYLLGEEVGPKRVEFLRGMLQIADIPTSISPGELLRTGWRMRILHLFDDLPVVDLVSGGTGIYVDHRVEHSSALVRVLGTRTFGFLYRGIDIFVAAYFAGLPGNESRALETRSDDLIDALRRESHRRERGEGGRGGQAAE